MVTVADVLAVLDEVSPSRWALPSDRVGLQVGDPAATVQRAAVSLDRSLGAVQFATEIGAQLLLSHHPLFYQPLTGLTSESHAGNTALQLATHGIAFIAAHTNWDAAPGGVNDTLAELLGLAHIRPFGEVAPIPMTKLVFTVPGPHVEALIDAAAAAGAGLIGLYNRCAYSGSGVGTFQPTAGADPYVGSAGQRQRVDEVRVEMSIPARLAHAAKAVVRECHPYEEPVIDLYSLDSHPEMPLSRIGALGKPVAYAEFVRQVDAKLETRSLAWGDPDRAVQAVAVVGGAADGEWAHALGEGADVLVTGEVRQHIAVEASESGLAILASGHYATEQPGASALAETMRGRLPDVDWSLFVPKPGRAGRPLVATS